MSFLNVLTDDQIALIGCVLALATAFAVMSLTWTARQSLQPGRNAAAAIKAKRQSGSPEANEVPGRKAA